MTTSFSWILNYATPLSVSSLLMSILLKARWTVSSLNSGV